MFFIWPLFVCIWSYTIVYVCRYAFIVEKLYENIDIYKQISTFDSCEINQNKIVYTIFRLIWNQMILCLVPNQSENGKYNLIWIEVTRMNGRFCVCIVQPTLGRLHNPKI